MYTSIKVSGFGGQGVMVIGQLICYSAINEGKNVTYLPRYGPEKRGGFADCNVMISDTEIGSLMNERFDCLLALNQDAVNNYASGVKPGGTLVVNTTMAEAPEREDINIYKIDAAEVAGELGSSKVMNVVLIGAFLKATGLLNKDDVVAALDMKLGKKEEFIELNRRALDAGMHSVKKA